MSPRLLRSCVGALVALTLSAAAGHAFDRAQVTGAADPQQAVAFNIYLKLPHPEALERLLAAQQDPASSSYHRWLTPAEFRARFAPDPATLDGIARELAASGLTVTETHTHHLHVTGTASAVEHAFATRLAQANFAGGATRLAATRTLTLTPALRAAGAVVSTFSDVVRMHSHAMRAAMPDNRYSNAGPYWFGDLKQAYDFPSYQAYTGAGVTIGILMAGGYNAIDMNLYFNHERLLTPTISEVTINGGSAYAAGTSDETHLDIQQSGGMAPGAHIVLFNLPDLSDSSILDGLVNIVDTNAADIVSMSFGAPELAYTPAYTTDGSDQTGILTLYDELFAQGNAEGITFVASSGDLGARSMPAAACLLVGAKAGCGPFKVSVESPASSPHVTGVGGTNLVTSYDAANPSDYTSTYVSESAFADRLMSDVFYGTPASNGVWGSGGGRSAVFARPTFQQATGMSGTTRMVPDIAMHMGGCPSGAVTPCPGIRSSDAVVIGEQLIFLIGTSAAAPDFAGLLALKLQRLNGRVGNENTDIYALAAGQALGVQPKVFRTTIGGFNNAFYTRPGYNMVLGNGTPDGRAFIGAPNIAPAGVPQTPSNP